MKPDARIFILFSFPFIAIISIAIINATFPEQRSYVQDRPQFLNAVDQLSISSGEAGQAFSPDEIRDVFSFHGPSEARPEKVLVEDVDDLIEAPVTHTPVTVSMILNNGSESFSVIDGQKMRVGEGNSAFTLKSIRDNFVTVRYSDGIEETINVKAY